MGDKHTFYENVKHTQVMSILAATPGLFTEPVDTVFGRGNSILMFVGNETGTMDPTNYFEMSVEDSDDLGGPWTPVVNGANLGEEINVVWSNETETLNENTVPPTTAIGAVLRIDDITNTDENYIAEYFGSKRYFRVIFVAVGLTVTGIAALGMQVGLRNLPALVINPKAEV